MDKRRLFWGFEVDAKWPELPKDGRIVEPGSRHATMLFLGEVDYEVLKPFIDTYKPDISATPSGVLDKLLFLPNKKKPRVVSIGGYLNEPAPCLNEIKRVKKEMELLGFKTEDREWLLHITVARAPFDLKAWEGLSVRTPFALTGICLYQSFQGLIYKKLHAFSL